MYASGSGWRAAVKFRADYRTYANEQCVDRFTLFPGGEELGTAMQYAYDGDRMLIHYTMSNGVYRRYVYGPGVDEPIVFYKSSQSLAVGRTFIMADERGSVISTANSAGVTQGLAAYDEYGLPSALIAAQGYTGQVWLQGFNMWYYKARVYSPSLGRFMQTDPIGYGDGMNWYGYVGADPVNARDPTGLEEDEIVVTGAKLKNERSFCDDNWSASICQFGSGGLAGALEGLGWSGQEGFADIVVTGATTDHCRTSESAILAAGTHFWVWRDQLNAIAAEKYLQHSWPISMSGQRQSTFGGAITNPETLADFAQIGIMTHGLNRAGGLNSRITFDTHTVVGRDIYSDQSTTTFLTVILSPPVGVYNGLPVRVVVSIFPGC